MDEHTQDLLNKVPGWNNRQAKVTELGGGITNQNFVVDIDDESYVLRVCSTSTDHLGIRRDHEYACLKIIEELGIGAEVIHYSPGDGILVVRFVEGKSVSSEGSREPDKLRRIVEAIKCYHNGPEFPGHFSAFQTARDYHGLAIDKGVTFPDTIPEVFELTERIESSLAEVQKSVPCHNDLLAANFLDDGEKIWILDWEYAAMGDLFFDLGNFSVNQELNDEQAFLLLENYFGEVQAQHVAHLNLMKLASDLREAFWGFLQSGISTLDFDYSTYAGKHLERFLSRASVPAFSSWLDEVAKMTQNE